MMKVWALGTFDRESVEEMIGRDGVFLLSDGDADEMRAIGGLIGDRVIVAPANGIALEFARLRARVLGIDPFSDPIGSLQKLQRDLTNMIKAETTEKGSKRP